MTLKVQFKKTGVFNNAMPQNSATIACVLAGAGTPVNAAFSPGTNRAHNASSVMTPLSAASSPTGAYGPGASPTFSPSINSLLIFLGPPSPPTVSEICAQVAAKLKEVRAPRKRYKADAFCFLSTCTARHRYLRTSSLCSCASALREGSCRLVLVESATLDPRGLPRVTAAASNCVGETLPVDFCPLRPRCCS